MPLLMSHATQDGAIIYQQYLHIGFSTKQFHENCLASSWASSYLNKTSWCRPHSASHHRHSLNFHSWRHMGHSCWTCWEFSHFMMQWMWKQCEHWPHTSGQSSPGILQSGQHPSKGTRHIPQLSSLAIQRQEATLVQPVRATLARKILEESETHSYV